ncbi:MAG: hypothetical protein HC898_11375 [Phycisphaerales bacterium]|nr:hypothetical protein [Phycisphaerales bacterium]
MKRLGTSGDRPPPHVTYLFQLLICAIAAAMVVLVFFAPRYVAWSGFELPESWSNPEINRAIETLRLIEDPFGYQPSPSNRVIVWRLLFVLPWHCLSLPKLGFLLMPFVGCVAALMLTAQLLYREGKSWRIAFCGTALTATCSWFFVSTGWLTYFDSWVLLGLLAIGFVNHIGWGITACVLVPWIDERFVLTLPLAMTARAIYFDWLVKGEWRNILRQGMIFFAALLPWAGVRYGLILAGIDRGMKDGAGQPFDRELLSNVLGNDSYRPGGWAYVQAGYLSHWAYGFGTLGNKQSG